MMSCYKTYISTITFFWIFCFILFLISIPPTTSEHIELIPEDNDDVPCNTLPVSDLECDLNITCIFNQSTTTTCEVSSDVLCSGSRSFEKEFNCLYCWQLPYEKRICETNDNCASGRDKFIAECQASSNVLCLGKRTFLKKERCNFTTGKRLSTAVVLSLTLGAFAADRFYLGQIGWGFFKLCTCGGVGFWTLLDVLLIGIGYVGPSDGSLYYQPAE
eukprot:gb/GECH01000194.1/.p1 GENE.gb/GECH01000194.1/~~gb/GECH01000194.1/.p1  ORF type:complete len:217 (+),score=33.54 gb/GECH01000194.1/:1-651(+)